MSLNKHIRTLTVLSLAAASFAACAQTTSRNADPYSLLPYTSRGYAGLNLGQAEFNNACGTAGFGCDKRSNVSGHIYTGGMFNDWAGAELGYLHTGKADRAGGTTRAQAVNVSLLLRAPLGAFNVFAKGGGSYSQTEVTTGLLSGVAAGKRRGWGGSYGVGAGYDLTPNAGLVLEWTRHEMPFAGHGGRQDVDLTSVGYVHRF